MKEVSIPDVFLPTCESDIQLFDYHSFKNLEKQLVYLSKNTFSFLVEGQKEVIGRANHISITNKRFLLMESGRCLMTEKLSTDNKDYRSILLFFSDEAILHFMRTFEIPQTKQPEKKSVSAFQYDAFTTHYVNSLIEISKLPKSKQAHLLTLKLQEILLYLIEKKGSEFLQAILAQSKLNSPKLISIVEANKFNRLSLEELSFLCNMSVSSFKRAFVKHYGRSPMKWFQDQRLSYAANLLKQEGKRPSDIYLEVGYENLSSFIKAFRLKYGKTPKQFV